MRRIDTVPAPLLEVRDLRLLLALRQTGTTKAAGALLHLSQPSISRALLSLEERLGEPLFQRTAKGLLPTPCCDELADGGAEILAQLGKLERSVRNRTNSFQRIRLVSECHTAYHWLPSAITAFRSQLPNVELSLRLNYTYDPIAALAAGKVDAALLTSPIEPSRTLEVKPLFADEMVFVVAENHPLAKKRQLKPDDLRQHKLISARPTAAEQEWFLATVFGRTKPRLDVFWVPLSEAIVELVRAGQGIGLLTEWVATPYLNAGGIVAKRISRRALKRPWRLAWQRSIGATGAQLVRVLKAHEAGC